MNKPICELIHPTFSGTIVAVLLSDAPLLDQCISSTWRWNFGRPLHDKHHMRCWLLLHSCSLQTCCGQCLHAKRYSLFNIRFMNSHFDEILKHVMVIARMSLWCDGKYILQFLSSGSSAIDWVPHTALTVCRFCPVADHFGGSQLLGKITSGQKNSLRRLSSFWGAHGLHKVWTQDGHYDLVIGAGSSWM